MECFFFLSVFLSFRAVGCVQVWERRKRKERKKGRMEECWADCSKFGGGFHPNKIDIQKENTLSIILLFYSTSSVHRYITSPFHCGSFSCSPCIRCNTIWLLERKSASLRAITRKGARSQSYHSLQAAWLDQHTPNGTIREGMHHCHMLPCLLN